jgi:hypothetical protein
VSVASQSSRLVKLLGVEELKAMRQSTLAAARARGNGGGSSKDGGKRLRSKDATSTKKVAETADLAARGRRARSPSPETGPVELAADGDSTDAAEPVKVSAKKRLPLTSPPPGSESGERDKEDSESDSDSDDDDVDSDDEDGEERDRLKRVASNAEERADMKALQDDPPYNPEKNVKRGSAHRNKRPATPGDLDDASDSQAEAGATGKSRGKRRATGTPSKNGRPNRRVSRKEKLARNAAASQASVSSTASTASTQQYQHHPSLAALHAVLPAVQVS